MWSLGVEVGEHLRRRGADCRPGRLHRGGLLVAGERLDRAKHFQIGLKGKLRLLRVGAVPCATHSTRTTGMTTGVTHSLDSLAFQVMGGKMGPLHARAAFFGGRTPLL